MVHSPYKNNDINKSRLYFYARNVKLLQVHQFECLRQDFLGYHRLSFIPVYYFLLAFLILRTRQNFYTKMDKLPAKTQGSKANEGLLIASIVFIYINLYLYKHYPGY